MCLWGQLLRLRLLGQFAFFNVLELFSILPNQCHCSFPVLHAQMSLLTFTVWLICLKLYIKHAWILLHLFQKLHLVCSTISVQLHSTIISWQILFRPPDKAHEGSKVEGNADPALSEYSTNNINSSKNNRHLLNTLCASHSVYFSLLTLTDDNPVT